MIRHIDLSDLPKWDSGGNKGKINWNKSIGHKVKFIYSDINGFLEIFDYDKHKQKVIIKYNNSTMSIKTGHFKNGAIGSLLGLVNHEYRYKTGDITEISTGCIEILEVVPPTKDSKCRTYKCRCLNDEYVFEATEYNIINGRGCSVCSNRTVVKGVNDIATTHPHLKDFFVNINDAHNNSYGSRKEVLIKCANCLYEKKASINKLTQRGFSCRKCGDGISYSEKFLFNLLEQLNVSFDTQKRFHWSNNRQYDFYIPSLNMIIEAHGLQHFENNFSFSESVELKSIQENDNYKYQLAIENKISNYIILDCRNSEDEWIKNQINKSLLPLFFDLNKIDWLKCHMFACSSRVKEACTLWNEFSQNTEHIRVVMKLSRPTIIKYLKQGNKLGWCNYNSKNNMVVNGKDNGVKKQIPIIMYDKTGAFLGFFQSATELSKISIEKFGVKLSQAAISSVCRGVTKHHKGFNFDYVCQEVTDQ